MSTHIYPLGAAGLTTMPLTQQCLCGLMLSFPMWLPDTAHLETTVVVGQRGLMILLQQWQKGRHGGTLQGLWA